MRILRPGLLPFFGSLFILRRIIIPVIAHFTASHKTNKKFNPPIIAQPGKLSPETAWNALRLISKELRLGGEVLIKTCEGERGGRREKETK
jgi:hypothetical protein